MRPDLHLTGNEEWIQINGEDFLLNKSDGSVMAFHGSFAEWYRNEEAALRSIAPSVRTEDPKSGKQGKRRSNKC